jgi:iron-sulfur cluster assembly protein
MKILPVHLTESARREISSIMEKKKIPEGYGLRLAVKGGGCAGFSFVIGFDKPGESDEKFMVDKIPLFIEKKHFLHLAGMKVDFIENETEKGFVFQSGP